MLLEEALQKCLFLYLSVHPLASQLAGCVLGVEYSLSTCGLENPAVPFLSLLPVLPYATFPRAGCSFWHRGLRLCVGALWGIVALGCLSGAVRRGAKQAFPCRGCSWPQCAAQGWHPASCWQWDQRCHSGNVHGFSLLGCSCAGPSMGRGCVAVWEHREPSSHALQPVPGPLWGDKNDNHRPHSMPRAPSTVRVPHFLSWGLES